MLRSLLGLSLIVYSLLGAATESVMEVVPLFNRPANELQPLIVPLLENNEQLIGNGFSFILKTTPARQRELKNLIQSLDTRLANLSIRVKQSKDKTADQLNAGIGVEVVVPLSKPADVQGSVNAVYEQRQQQQSLDSEQVIRALEGKPALIKIGSQQPFTQRFHYQTGYRQRVTQLIEASRGFSALPRLQGEQVFLEISPWSEQFTTPNTLETQAARTSVNCKLGQWVEIGTINEQSHSTNNGLLSTGHTNQQNTVHILIKVDKVQ